MKQFCLLLAVALFALACVAATAPSYWTTNPPGTRSTAAAATAYGQLILRSQTVTSTNGYYLPTNALSAWPAGARTHGEAFIGNSNGVIYILVSTPGSTNWASTNKLAP